MADVPPDTMAPRDHALQIVFLGFAERAAAVPDAGTPLLKWNILGLKQVLLTPILPFPLAGAKLIFAVRVVGGEEKFDLKVLSDTGLELGWINVTLKVGSDLQSNNAVVHQHAAGAAQPIIGDVLAAGQWVLLLVSLPDGMIIERPSHCQIALVKEDGRKQTIGQFHVPLVEPIPLTEERLAAINSDPTAAKAVRFTLGCKNCTSKLRTYAAVERNPKQEEEGFAWYRDLPDEFVCSCERTRINLESIRKNLFALLGHRIGSEANSINFVPAYEAGSLEATRRRFVALLDSNAPEEELQKFLESNPIMFHQFPSERIFFRPPILNLFKADFAVVTPQKELILIEIEKTRTRLLVKSGDEAAQLRHVFDQVRNWLHIVDDHRLAVLDGLKISRDAVASIKGLVIAGRDRGYDAEHLRRLKGLDRGRMTLLTYDDLAFGLAALIGRIDQL